MEEREQGQEARSFEQGEPWAEVVIVAVKEVVLEQVPGGDCICLKFGEREPDQLGSPCFEKKCPKCGEIMTRE